MSALVMPVCELIHREMERVLFPGAIAVDCTVGNGGDTVFLAKAVGEKGLVYGFDIQPLALEKTAERLSAAGCADWVKLICDGHEHLANYVKTEVDCAVFNLGYLPRGDHEIITKKETTVSALETVLSLLRPGGAVFIALYWGHPGGEEERLAVESFAMGLAFSQWDVAETSFPNKNKAPLMMVIQKKLR